MIAHYMRIVCAHYAKIKTKNALFDSYFEKIQQKLRLKIIFDSYDGG